MNKKLPKVNVDRLKAAFIRGNYLMSHLRIVLDLFISWLVCSVIILVDNIYTTSGFLTQFLKLIAAIFSSFNFMFQFNAQLSGET